MGFSPREASGRRFLLTGARPYRYGYRMTDSTPASTAPLRGVPALIGAIVSAILVPVSFVYGIGAALNGSGTGAGVFEVLFFVGLALGLAAIVISIVHLVRGARKLLPILTILIALLPFAGVLIVYLANLTAG